MSPVGPIPLFDPLMRPVKYVAGGGFIVTTSPRAVAFLVKSGAVSELSLPSTSRGNINAAYASSYHNVGGKDVFLISGVVPHVGDTPSTSVIYVSNDMTNWRIARQLPDWSFSAALVWSGGAFHASYVVSTPAAEGDEGGGSTEEFGVSSVDGETWSGTESYGGVTSEEPEYRSPFPGRYCMHHACVDAWGQHVPDGVMATALMPETPYAVSYAAGIGGNIIGPPSNRITSPPDIVKVVSVLETVGCVAGSGGTLLAGGGDGLALSSDGGTTWKKLDLPSEPAVMSITGRK